MVTLKRPVLGEAHHSTGQNSISQSNCSERFPTCKLHGTKIITEFPQGCLYREKYPSKRLLQYKDQGFSHLSDDSWHSGLSLLVIQDCCNRCLSEIGNYPHIVQLKQKMRIRQSA